MGFRTPSSSNTLTLNSTGTSGEIPFMQVGPISALGQDAPIRIEWVIQYVATAFTTFLSFQLRRGQGVGGLLLATYVSIQTAVGQGLRTGSLWIDTPGSTAPQFYSLNVTNNTTGGSTTFAENFLFAFSL